LIIIYHCFGGAHSSVMAAAIHLGLVTDTANLRNQDVLNLPYFDMQDEDEVGSIRFVGCDAAGNGVFIMGRSNQSAVTRTALRSCADLLGIGEECFCMTDALPYVNPLMIMGGYLSRRLRLVGCGKQIAALGTRLAVPALRYAVKQTRQRILNAGMRTNSRMTANRVYLYHSGGRYNIAVCAAHAASIGSEPRLDSVRSLNLAHKVFGQNPGEAQLVALPAADCVALAVALGRANRFLPRTIKMLLEICGIHPSKVYTCDVSNLGSIHLWLAGACFRLGFVGLAESLLCRILRAQRAELATIGMAHKAFCAELDP